MRVLVVVSGALAGYIEPVHPLYSAHCISYCTPGVHMRAGYPCTSAWWVNSFIVGVDSFTVEVTSFNVAACYFTCFEKKIDSAAFCAALFSVNA